MMVTRANLLHAALWMLAFFVHMAGIFLLLDAEFIAVVQVMVYAGAILVLYLFLIMLLDVRELAKVRQRHGSATVASLVAGVLGAVMVVVLARGRFQGAQGHDTPAAIARLGGDVGAVAHRLFTTYLLPFEVASFLLLVAMVGAVVLAKRRL
ncbi:MAG: NADH-quinone oxidoreductase subunit J [Nitrospirae bacterium]|nr:MAG: NADH-quinone oxidoreductase subunit J [Nitrospirota bacterium]